MKKKFLSLLIVIYCVSPLMGMKQTSEKVYKKFKPEYIRGILVNPIKGYPVKNIPYKSWDKNITINGTLVKTPKVKGYRIKNSDFVPIKQETEDIPEAEYAEIPVSKKRTRGEYFRTRGSNFGFFKAKAQNTERNFNQRVRKYSTQTHRSEKELKSFFRRELLIAKQQGGEKAVSTKYHQLARKYHPDIKKDSGTAMKILNDTKEEVDKIDQKGSRRDNMYDYHDFNYDFNNFNYEDLLHRQAEYLKKKRQEEKEEDIRSGTILEEAPLNKEELKIRADLLKYADDLKILHRARWEIEVGGREGKISSFPDPEAYSVKIADGTIIYINKCALYDNFMTDEDFEKDRDWHKSPAKDFARRIYRLQQQTLPKDFTNHPLFKEKVYNRLVSALAVLYGRARGDALIKDENLRNKVSRAENELEIEHMITDQLKDYEEEVRVLTYNDSANIEYVQMQYTYHPKAKELADKPIGFINGYYNISNNFFAGIYDLYCNEYVVGNIHKYHVEPTPYPFLLLKCYFDALKNNSLPKNNPYSIKNLSSDILEEQERKGYKLIDRSVWSKFSNLF